MPDFASPSHAAQLYLIDGESFGPTGNLPKERFRLQKSGLRTGLVEKDGDEQYVVVDYTRLVNATPALLAEATSTDLGRAMIRAKRLPEPAPENSIPAGYTYLGQFIAHDLTHIFRAGQQIQTARSGTLDLDSIFSEIGEDGSWQGPNAENLMETVKKGVLFPIGRSSERSRFYPVFFEDLPRKNAKTPIACIADRRNDDVLPTAQVHVALLKFINLIHAATDDIKVTRRLVTRCFQSVVLHDYLERLVPCDVYQDVVKHNRRRWVAPGKGVDAVPSGFKIPIEFAMAFRFGHSMVRPVYPVWAEFRQVTPEDFWRNTANHNPGLNDSLTTGISWRWISNWFQLLDFSGTRFAQEQHASGVQRLHAAPIETALAPALGLLPPTMRDPRAVLDEDDISQNLAERTLRMHAAVGVPSALQFIDRLGDAVPEAWGGPLTALAKDTIRDDLRGTGMSDVQVEEVVAAPPLWYYVLLEAASLKDGVRLGPLGGRLVAETLHAAIHTADNSLIRDPLTESDFDVLGDASPSGGDGIGLAALIAAIGHPHPVSQRCPDDQPCPE